MGKANIVSVSSPARRLKKWSGTGSRKTPSYVARSCLQIPFSMLLGSDRVRRMLHLYSRTNDERSVSLRWGHNMDGCSMIGQRPLISKFYGKSATPYRPFIWTRKRRRAPGFRRRLPPCDPLPLPTLEPSPALQRSFCRTICASRPGRLHFHQVGGSALSVGTGTPRPWMYRRGRFASLRHKDAALFLRRLLQVG